MAERGFAAGRNGGLVVLLRRVGAESVLRSIERVGPNYVLVLVAPVVGMVLHCCGWLVLLPKALRPRPAMALAAYVASQLATSWALAWRASLSRRWCFVRG